MNLFRPLANLFGYDIVKKEKTLKIQWHLQKIFADFKIDTVLDVGANRGQYGKLLRSIGFKGQIHSFEPVRMYYKELIETSKGDKNWFSYNYALGRESGELRINIDNVFSSFYEYSDYYLKERGKVGNSEIVKISTLDNFIKESFSGPVQPKIHLKLDTQGFDVEAFAGGQRNIKNISTFQSEMALKKIYKNMPDITESLNIYRKCGFEVSGLFPVSKEKSGHAIIEVDCVMINGTLVKSL
ncbi:FkbM family methyltransferase [uncultured Microbulbifer sp.]|uniref:FkbM family methyltransferase n=1 Tax=uncultured Microbulbifer sp. TaxID=348147 RepID=UPI0026240F1B|nr:FkbM family methyltransferase [uncultured Microbulbifer sp.]